MITTYKFDKKFWSNFGLNSIGQKNGYSIRVDTVTDSKLESKQVLLTTIYECIQELKKAQTELEKDLVDGG